jgi:hypothetical protein
VARPITVARVLACAAFAIAVGRSLPRGGKIATLVESAGVAACYVALLVLTRELGREDTRVIASVIGRRKG